jgi:glyceraldehyde-3-phosphate dehydrogenase (NADP+)
VRDGKILFWEGAGRGRAVARLRRRRGRAPSVASRHPSARLDGAEALKALDAAVAAYERGRGIWPTMPVADRIAHVEAFVAAMRRQRDRVIRLIMLESTAMSRIGVPIGATRWSAAEQVYRLR